MDQVNAVFVEEAVVCGGLNCGLWWKLWLVFEKKI